MNIIHKKARKGVIKTNGILLTMEFPIGMAPTVCLPELSVVRSTGNVYSRQRRRWRRRQRVCRDINGKQKRLEFRRLPIVTSTVEKTPTAAKSLPYENHNFSESVDISVSSSNVSTKVPECDVVFSRREGLLSVVIRTLALIRRNRVLQERVNALRVETRDFIRSVLNNPQNKRRQQNTIANRCKDEMVSSSTERIVLKPTLFHAQDSTGSSPDIVTSTCRSPWENDN